MRKGKEPNSLSVLLRIPVFRRLWVAISVSSLGDWLGLLATTSLAAYLTKGSSGLAQGAAVSGVLLTRLLPDLLLGPVAGALVDRIDRRKIAIVGDTLAGLLYLSIAVGGNLTWLLVAQFLVEAVGLFSNPAKQAMWVNIVPRERLAVANQLNYVSIYGMVPVAAALFALLSTVAQFFGASAAAGSSSSGALISGPTSALAINIALIIDAVTYFFCALTVLLSRHLIPAFVGERSTGKSIFSLIAEGVSFVKNSKVMRALYIGILGAFGAGGLTAGVAQAYVSALGAGNAGYGILFGSVFSGLALGMLTGPRILPTVPRRMIFTTAIGGAGLVLVVMSTLQDFLGAAISSTLMGWCAGIAWITGFTMIGHEVTDQLRGRVFAFVMSSVRLTLLATIAVGPIVAGLIGPLRIRIGDFRWHLSGAAIVLLFGGLIALLVANFAGRQVGGLASALVRRILGRGRSEMLSGAAEHDGAFIAVEGADAASVDQVWRGISEHLRADGWQVVEETSVGAAWPAGGGARPVDGAPESSGDALRSVARLSDVVTASVRPALVRGAVVVYAGYVDDTVVRFGAVAGLGEEHLLRVAMWAVDGLLPDLTILVDSPETLVSARPESTAADQWVPDRAGGPGEPDPPPSLGAAAPDPEGTAAPDEEPISPFQAFRDRASSAPERYLVVKVAGPEDPLGAETAERIASVLRLRSPHRLESVPAGPVGGLVAGGLVPGTSPIPFG